MKIFQFFLFFFLSTFSLNNISLELTNRFGAKKWRNQLEELERLLEHERTSKSFFANFVELIVSRF